MLREKQLLSHLTVVLESLGLVPLVVMQLSQFGQYMWICGSGADDLHQPLDRLLRVSELLVAETKMSRADGHLHDITDGGLSVQTR